ncbi:PAS domain-containing protein [Synoicihabitans lomoniglobus]|uniref:histidine kinase n=1 Tax=Synoicihabitans lomoniglobus TaxID=2909285 RepID=A0AAE9ZUJ1_9BACT|nr:PAS domain-containing protein [Opitutaceae bacterium LMO-M01]WED63269.1 PAS domain-containing protein [Opitutaceae bacterium LMO-M01]
MIAPAPIPREIERLQALRGYEQLDTRAERDFDDITVLAAQICGTPISLITLIDEDRQWFKSRLGVSVRETSRLISFCAHTIQSDQAMVVPDTAVDPRFADNPMVIGDPHVRFYLGVPLLTAQHLPIGTLCVIDREPREMSPAQVTALQSLSRQVMAQFELRKSTRALASHEARQRLAKEGSDLGSFEWNLVTGHIAGTRRHDEIWGFAPGEFSGDLNALLERVHPDDLDLAYRTLTRGATDQHVVECEIRVRLPEGPQRWLEVRGEFAFDRTGKADRAWGVVKDISERKKREQELANNRANLERAQRISRTGSWEYEVATGKITWSDEHYRIWGLNRNDPDMALDELISRIHPDDRAVHMASLDQWLASAPGSSHEAVEYRVIKPNGEVVHVRVDMDVHYDSAGQAERLFGTSQDVTRREETQRALATSRRQMEAALASMTDALFITDTQGRLIEFNDAFLTFHRFKHESECGLTLADYPEIFDVFMADGTPAPAKMWVVARALRGETVTSAEYGVRRKDTGESWVGSYSFAPMRNEDGAIIGSVVVARDITEQRRMETQLVESERRYHTLFDEMDEGFCVIDVIFDEHDHPVDFRFLVTNPAFEVQTGLKNVEGETMRKLAPDLEEYWFETYGRVALTGESAQLVNWAEELSRWYDVYAFRFGPTEQRQVAVLFKDVTERKLAEQRIYKLNRVYLVLSEINQAITRESDQRAMLQDACRIAVEQGEFVLAWIGMREADAGGLTVVAHAGADEDTMAQVAALVSGGQIKCPFTRVAVESGEHGVCNDSIPDAVAGAASWGGGYRAMASLPLTQTGVVVGVLNLYADEAGVFDDAELQLLNDLAKDISFGLEVAGTERARVAATEALLQSESQLSNAMTLAKMGHWVYEIDSNLITLNDHIYRLYQTTVEQEGGYAMSPERFVERFLEPGDADGIKAEIEKARTTTDQHYTRDFEYGFRFGDGRRGRMAVRIFVVKDGRGRTVKIRGVSQDITAHRALEEQYRQSQKMDAIGQLAGGVAHDFNNILAAIMMQADLGAKEPATPAENMEAMAEIKEAARRASHLTRQLLAFGRRQIMQTTQLDLNRSVENMTQMLHRIVGEDVSLKLNLHPTPLLTRADSGMIDQVLLNLVVNARDAMPTGGLLIVETGLITLTENGDTDSPDLPPGDYVTLGVVDSGCGIDPEVKARIFEPFFTTKAPGTGTGLGLATVFGIVKQHGGAIDLRSETGEGSSFTVYLRSEKVRESDDAAIPVLPELKRGTETILLVEDDPSLRKLTKTVLVRQGYRVLEAGNGPEAVTMMDEATEKISLLLTDVVMPAGMTGWQLAQRLQARYPELRVIFTSGYSSDVAGREMVLKNRQNFIPKPCSADQLLRMVRTALDA